MARHFDPVIQWEVCLSKQATNTLGEHWFGVRVALCGQILTSSDKRKFMIREFIDHPFDCSFAYTLCTNVVKY